MIPENPIRHFTTVTDVHDDTVVGVLVAGSGFDRQQLARPSAWFQSASVEMALDALGPIVETLLAKMDSPGLAQSLRPVVPALHEIATQLTTIQRCFAQHWQEIGKQKR